MTRNRRAAIVAGCALTIGVPLLAMQPDDPPCIALDLTLHTYDGPIVIDGACVDDISYTPAALIVVAHDLGDGIYHNGFETTP